LKLRGTETEKNLLKSFAGESQASMRYRYFAEKASEEGYEQIAEIFMETSLNEKYHAERFFSFLEGGEGLEITAAYPAGFIGTTLENLNMAADGEHEEFVELYPAFAKKASEEGFPAVAALFKLIGGVEVEHESRYRRLIGNLEREQVFVRETAEKWVCRKCGHTHENTSSPNLCPICKAGQSFFEIKAANF